ncbi:MAG: NAD(P)/FAD-dependent oxidoreductase [Bacteroidota bacterium]
MKTILILGAGTGGIITAREISRYSGNEEDITLVKILVFEKEEKSVFSPSLPWLMVGDRKPKQLYENIKKLNAAGLEVINGEIEAVDPKNISVKVNGKEYKGDYMVVSLGVEQVIGHNLDQFGYNFFTLEGATQFNEKLENFSGGKIAILVSSLPFKSPAAPYEAAMLIEDYVRRHDLSKNTEVSIYTPEKGPMEFAGKEMSEELQALLKGKGIHYFPDHQVTSVTENTLKFSNNNSYEYDLLAFTPTHRSPAVIRNSPLAGESGWVDVNRNTMETNFPDVYAIGDITNIPLDTGISLPKIGVFARHQAEIVAHNIGRKMDHKVPDQTFTGEGEYFIEYGKGLASQAEVHLYDPSGPDSKMKDPQHLGHWSKWWAEKYWFFKNF